MWRWTTFSLIWIFGYHMQLIDYFSSNKKHMKIDYLKTLRQTYCHITLPRITRVWSFVNCKSLNSYNFDFYEGNENFFLPVLRISFLSRHGTPTHTGWKAVWNVCSFRKKELSRFASSFLSRCLYVLNRSVAHNEVVRRSMLCFLYEQPKE